MVTVAGEENGWYAGLAKKRKYKKRKYRIENSE
jgi:hypothetical protein